jgi:protein SCO1
LIVLLVALAAAPLFGGIRSELPALPVVDQDGRSVDFHKDVADGRVVAINFIFTSCRGVCPLLGANFAAVQREMRDEDRSTLRLVSISVDPATDTPPRLREWRARQGGADGWTLLTGTPPQVDALLAHLDAAVADRGAHASAVLIGSGGAWRRLDGLAAPRDILAWMRRERDGVARGAGERIYRDGDAGAGVTARLESGVTVPGDGAACANCHGRDGRGRSEAGRRAPAITWSALTKPYRGRARYDERSLIAALTGGVDPAGRALDAAMPRYTLSAANASAVVAYLKRLDAAAEPGVEDDTLRLGYWRGAAVSEPSAVDRPSVAFRRRIEWVPVSAAADGSRVFAVAAIVAASDLPALDDWAFGHDVPVVALIVTGSVFVPTFGRSGILVIERSPASSPDPRAVLAQFVLRAGRRLTRDDLRATIKKSDWRE